MWFHMYQKLLMRKAQSWFTGYNSNVSGHEKGRIRYFVYNGGMPKYRSVIQEVVDGNYSELLFEGSPAKQIQPQD